MDNGRHNLAETVRAELEDSYQQHGCGPEFWNDYQRVLARLVPEGRERTQVTNDVALLIEQLGIVQHAKLVPSADSSSR